MKRALIASVLFCLLAGGVASAAKKTTGQKTGGDASVGDASGRIDDLLAKGYTEAGIEPNAPVGDEVFLRRIYLDVIGRVPTLEEAKQFLDSKEKNKRSELIDELLESEGYVSHFFNYWADVLRVNESINNQRLPQTAYALWLKQELRSNTPYDDFVRKLVTAEGFIWENGAVGYYQRDRGMPLDNMSNTVRVFLGTRLECAQCHNHPFDKWTQMDYFQMAALSYGMDANSYESRNRKMASDHQREMRKEGKMSTKREDGKKYYAYQASRRVMTDLYNPIRYIAATERDRNVRLPHDYQYDDAKPKGEVVPAAMYGSEVAVEKGESRIAGYADWITSEENERFTLVVANRLWKKAMGVGLIEPVDELMEGTEASNPELMDFLMQRMKDVDYDMKVFLRDIYNSQTYQREADEEEVLPGMAYYFPGPKLRRMSAEQLWDSMVTLAVPEPDYYMPNLDRRLAQIDEGRNLYESLEGRSKKDFMDLLKKGTAVYSENYAKSERLSKDYAALRAEKGKEAEAKKVGKELSSLRNDSRNRLRKLAQPDGKTKKGNPEAVMGVFGFDGKSMSKDDVVTTMPKPASPKADPEMSKDEQKRFYQAVSKENTEWNKAVAQMARASELSTPAPRGHFLREFGQSDREVIENSSASASVPQALTLLNGPVAETLGNRRSVLSQNIEEAKTPEEKIETIYLSMLTRYPNDAEMALLRKEVEANGDSGYDNILWALVNSQNFRFVQ